MWFTAKFLLKYVQYNQEELLLRRKLLLFGTVLFLLLGSSLVVSVDAALMWSRTYEGAEIDIAYSLVATSDGGYALAGSMFVKTDELGDLEWNKTYGGIACSLVATSDGGYALAGANYSTATNYDFWLAKTDALGNIQWNRTYGGTGEDVAYSLVASTDGGYVLAGDTWSFGDGGADFWLVKTDANGVVEWNRMYGGAGDDCARALVATSDGGYAIAGIWNCATSYPLYNVGYYEGGDFWLVKTDALGIMQWNKTYGGTGGDLAFSLVTTSDGGYALAGTWDYIMAFFEGTADAWLVKTDSLGNMQWNKTYDGTGNNWGDDWACSVIATSDGGYALAGTAFYANYLDLEYGQQLYGDFWFVKTDELGVVPEYSSWLVPALVLTATAFIIVNKKRLLHKRL
jgi:hypothetical protein